MSSKLFAGARGASRLFVLSVAVGVLASGCSSSSDPVDAGPAGGPVTGAQDLHCTLGDGGHRVQVVSLDACHVDGGEMVMADDGGMSSDYGDTLFNTSGDDDDCKYHLAWSSTPVRENTDVTFTVTVSRLADGTPVTGASIDPEVFLSDTHPAPNSNPRTAEQGGGAYTVGPIRFDQPGQWTVRFHLFESCSDASEESPHAHGAFFVSVP